MQLTCTDDLLDFDGGDVDLLGELSDGLVGVLIGEGVNVDLHPWRAWQGRAAHGGVAVRQIRSQRQL